MADTRRELNDRNEQFPTHRDIERRAYEIYLERGQENDHAVEHWLTAEVQLLRERGKEVATPLKTATVVAGEGGIAEVSAPSSDRDFLIAEEERMQVRATEKLKQGGEVPVVPRTKTAAVAQQKTK